MNEVFATYRQRMAEHRADPGHIETDLYLAIGFLLGGGMPSCAAAVTVLMLAEFPDAQIPGGAPE